MSIIKISAFAKWNQRNIKFPGNIHFYRNFMENYISIHEIFKNGNNDTDLKLIYCFHMSKQTQY